MKDAKYDLSVITYSLLIPMILSRAWNVSELETRGGKKQYVVRIQLQSPIFLHVPSGVQMFLRSRIMLL